jgi:hypothetical protein
MGVDRLQDDDVPKRSDLIVRGSIAYMRQNDPFHFEWLGGASAPALLRISGISYATLSDIVLVTHPSNADFNKIHAFGLARRPNNGPGKTSNDTDAVVGNTVTRVTTITGNLPAGSGFTGTGSRQHADWTVTGHSTGTSLAAVQTPWQNMSTTGARLCYRTVDGVTGTTPLWPWPMNDRIKAATSAAGRYTGPCTGNCVGGRAARTPTDVTAELETLLGPIPDHCKR